MSYFYDVNYGTSKDDLQKKPSKETQYMIK